MTAHSEFRKGQRVMVFLKGEDTPIIGKYVDKHSKFIELVGHLIPRIEIRQISIYKGEPTDKHKQ